jgi:hypothetical protein
LVGDRSNSIVLGSSNFIFLGVSNAMFPHSRLLTISSTTPREVAGIVGGGAVDFTDSSIGKSIGGGAVDVPDVSIGKSRRIRLK